MKKILFGIMILLMGLCYQSGAQGDLLVTPARIVFDDKQKQELSLVNMGKDTTTYSITFVNKRMGEDGSFVNIDKPDSGQLFAEPYLRIFPRQVTLAPGETQVIMIQCRHEAGMMSGEYRSHLFFRSEKNYLPLGSKSSGSDSASLSVQLTPIFGMSIPVIIHNGAVNVSAKLSDLKLESPDTAQYLKLTINRSGNISIYGNLTVVYTPVQGKPYQVGEVRGIGVYSNLNKRYVSIKLNRKYGMSLNKGKLKVRYTSPEESRSVVYAEEELIIN